MPGAAQGFISIGKIKDRGETGAEGRSAGAGNRAQGS